VAKIFKDTVYHPICRRGGWPDHQGFRPDPA
jgi:hypothetical protein